MEPAGNFIQQNSGDWYAVDTVGLCFGGAAF